MRNAIKIILAVCWAMIIGLLVALVVLQCQGLRKDNSAGPVNTAQAEKGIDQLIHEKQGKIDSIRADTSNDVNGAIRYLQRRYR